MTFSFPLYVARPVLNGDDLVAWAREQGFSSSIQADDLHVTFCYSKEPVDLDAIQLRRDAVELSKPVGRSVAPLGDGGAIVLKLSPEESAPLRERWAYFLGRGASWDWPTYQAHITITYDGEGVEIDDIEPYAGSILLGGETASQLNENYASEVRETSVARKSSEKTIHLDVLKTRDGGAAQILGVIIGFAMVSKVNGREYVDVQGHHIPEDVMMKAAVDFMSGDRPALDMHGGEPVGQVLFGFPLTQDVADALQIETRKTGFLVGMKPRDKKMLKKFLRGEYTGFSIGGMALLGEEVEFDDDT